MMILMSKQVTGEVTTLFLSSVIMLLALRYTEERKIRYIFFMSAVAAMATMEKWHGGAGGVFIGLMLLLYAVSVRDFIKRGVIALVTYIVSIIFIAPDITWNLRGAMEEFFKVAIWDNPPHPGYFNNLFQYKNISQCML